MEHNIIVFKVKGIRGDVANSLATNDYLYDALNIRIEPMGSRTGNSPMMGSDTGYVISNEKFPKSVQTKDADGNKVSILGTVVGYCVIDKELVLFTKDSAKYDRIYVVSNISNTATLELKWEGLGLIPTDTRIDTIGIYETESIKKVYWLDGINPMRYCNICDDVSGYTIDQFSSIPKIVTYDTGASGVSHSIVADFDIASVANKGLFPAGTVQYVACYFNKNGAKSNPIYISPIYYTYMINSDLYNRGGNMEGEVMSNSFNITIKPNGAEAHFDYIRLYSVFRDNQNGTPQCQIVDDFDISDGNQINYVDTHNGEACDINEVLNFGGYSVVPQTFEQKDNTLFFGNIKYNNNDSKFDEEIETVLENTTVKFAVDYNTSLAETSKSGIYPYTFQLDKPSNKITTFKANEFYSFAVQVQFDDGSWSRPYPLE